jgi:hypothetical protein
MNFTDCIDKNKIKDLATNPKMELVKRQILGDEILEKGETVYFKKGDRYGSFSYGGELANQAKTPVIAMIHYNSNTGLGAVEFTATSIDDVERNLSNMDEVIYPEDAESWDHIIAWGQTHTKNADVKMMEVFKKWCEYKVAADDRFPMETVMTGLHFFEKTFR